MTAHELEFKELIDTLGSKESYDRLKPKLAKKVGMIMPTAHSTFLLSSDSSRIYFSLNVMFTVIAFKDASFTSQFKPYVFEMVGSYTEKLGMQYEKIVVDAHFEDADGYHKVSIESNENHTLKEFIEQCKEQLDDNFDELSPEEQTVKALCGYVRPTGRIVDDITQIHNSIESVASKTYKRYRKIRVMELLAGQWFYTSSYNKEPPNTTKVISLALTNGVVTYFVVQVYIFILLFVISLAQST